MILVCAADDFRKYWQWAFNKNNLKKSVISKSSSVWCISSWLDWFVITCTSIRLKLQLKCLFFSKVDFYIFEPQNREVIENSSKVQLNFSPLKCTYFSISLALSQKLKFKG